MPNGRATLDSGAVGGVNMWNLRVIVVEIIARYIDSLSHERKSWGETFV